MKTFYNNPETYVDEMLEGIGRAKWFAERSRSEIDPGAVSGALIIQTVCEYLLEKKTA